MLPPGAPDAEHSGKRQAVASANALWGAYLKGKDLPIEDWAKVARELGEHVGPILDFLGGAGPPS
jgi:hypothetical protein